MRDRPTHILGLTLGIALLLLAACSPLSGPDPTPTPTATPTVTPSPTPSPTPTPTPTPSPTPTPTPFIPPTVAVEDGDSIQGCLERNLTPELLISLSMDDTSFTQEVMRTCLETRIPGALVFLLDPIIEDASECALDVSKTLTNSELIVLAGNDSAQKDPVVSRVSNDIVDCLFGKYGLDFLR